MMLEDGCNAVRLIISGKVQGVFFRGWTVEQANLLGLDGWVRNRADGTVEALIVGPDDLVDELVTQCWNGPNLAKVSNIVIHQAMGITPKGFTQKPTVNVDARRT